VLIASPDMATHMVHLREVLKRMRDFGLIINPAKCLFAQSSVPFLGHIVSATGVAPLDRHVTAIQEFPPPTDVAGLQRFLGMLNFFRRFLPAAAATLRPLTDALKSSPASTAFDWTPEMDNAFVQAKLALTTAATLRHPNPSADLSVAVDASAHHVGAVLQQREGSDWAPLGFFSKKLNAAEVNYSAFDRELLAAYSAVRHFRFLLEGRIFYVYTDHKPLVAAARRVTPPVSARQQRQLSFLGEFNMKMLYLPGKENHVADALSRPVSAVQQQPSVLQMDSTFLAAQMKCTECINLAASPQFRVRPAQGGVLVSYASASPRVLLPPAFRRPAFDELHQLSHPGIRASRQMISAKYLWPGMNKDVKLWVESCIDCQRSKVYRHQKAQVEEIPVPKRRFSHVHLDIVGPLKMTNSMTHLLTMVDRTSRWCEAVPLSDTTAKACFQAFINSWCSRFGIPSTITTDQGSQFTSSMWSTLMKELGVRHILTTAFHPQSNGMVERLHRSLKAALRARHASTSWVEHLPWVLLGLRTAPRKDNSLSAAEMVFGAAPSLPSRFIDARDEEDDRFHVTLQRIVSKLDPPPTSPPQEPGFVDRRLFTSSHVYVRRDGHVPPLEQLYHGPYRVVAAGEKVFRLMLGEKEVSISIDRLKPVVTEGAVKEFVPPRRGRPPRAPPTCAPPPRCRSRGSPARPPGRPPTRVQPPRRVRR
jgi:cleavage and polyadenylation specificity factor subunit 1